MENQSFFKSFVFGTTRESIGIGGDQDLPHLEDSKVVLPSAELQPQTPLNPTPFTLPISLTPDSTKLTSHDSPTPRSDPPPVISPALFKASPYVYKRKG